MPRRSATQSSSTKYTLVVAANLARYRRKQGWSTRAFADHTGMNLGTLYDIEHLVYETISLDMVEKLAEALGLHPIQLLTSEIDPLRDPVSERPVREALAMSLIAGRKSRGWSQTELAKRAGVARALIAAMELQRRNPSLDSLERVASALQLSVPDLLR